MICWASFGEPNRQIPRNTNVQMARCQVVIVYGLFFDHHKSIVVMEVPDISATRVLLESCLRADTVEDAFHGLRPLKIDAPEWYVQYSKWCATIGSKVKNYAAMHAYDACFGLIEVEGRLEVANFTSNQSFIVHQSASITAACIDHMDGFITVWVGDSNGNVSYYVKDVMSPEGFKLHGAMSVSAPVLWLGAHPWSFPAREFYVWVVTPKSIVLGGYSKHRRVGALLVFNKNGQHNFVRADVRILLFPIRTSTLNIVVDLSSSSPNLH